MKKVNKYIYLKVIQQYYTGAYGWEDVSEYECDSQYRNFEKSGKFRTNRHGKPVEISLISHDIAEYRLTGYPTRLICRKEINPTYAAYKAGYGTDLQMYESTLLAAHG